MDKDMPFQNHYPRFIGEGVRTASLTPTGSHKYMYCTTDHVSSYLIRRQIQLIYVFVLWHYGLWSFQAVQNQKDFYLRINKLIRK